MIDFLKLFVHVLVSPFKTQARLEAKIVLLRHQLNVLRRRVPSRPKLAVADLSLPFKGAGTQTPSDVWSAMEWLADRQDSNGMICTSA
jgi:hypothetical protein